MARKATGQPTVRKQRDTWVVRVDGIDTGTGQHRPRQLGTFNSQRSVLAAARSTRAEDRSTERGTVSWLVHRSVVRLRRSPRHDAHASRAPVRARSDHSTETGTVPAGGLRKGEQKWQSSHSMDSERNQVVLPITQQPSSKRTGISRASGCRPPSCSLLLVATSESSPRSSTTRTMPPSQPQFRPSARTKPGGSSGCASAVKHRPCRWNRRSSRTWTQLGNRAQIARSASSSVSNGERSLAVWRSS